MNGRPSRYCTAWPSRYSLPMLRAWVCALLSSFALLSCGMDPASSSRTYLPSPSSTSLPAPPHYVDLTGYREIGMSVERDGFRDGDIRAYAGGFSTPDGLRCRFAPWNSGKGGPPGFARCWGSLPGAPDWARTAVASNDRPGQFLREEPASENREFRLLPPMSTITVLAFEGDNVSCAVGDAGLTACRLHIGITNGQYDHGFVLSPQGSWTF